MDLPLDTPQYFFDDTWIAWQRHVTRRWLPAEVTPRPVIVPDRPWEGLEILLYGTVIRRTIDCKGDEWAFIRPLRRIPA